MNLKLESKLFSKYPKIFRQKDLSMQQTCMCWGVSTGDGWYKIIDMLCSFLQFDIDNNNYPQIEATQVKEKFGTLRFYYNTLEPKIKHKVFVWKGWSYLFKRQAYSFRTFFYNGRIDLGCFYLALVDIDSINHWATQRAIIQVAEYLSGITCESCGSTEKVSQTRGWIVTLCKKCLDKHILMKKLEEIKRYKDASKRKKKVKKISR